MRFFQVVQLCQEVVGVMSGPLIVIARTKIDTYLRYKFILNTSKIAVFLGEFHYF